MTVRFGVLGVGRIGRIHARNLATQVEGAELVAIADPRMDVAREVAARWHVPHVYADYHDVLRHPQVDAVVIATPTDTHARIIVEAAEAGKHIFCEKPIALDLAAIDQALETVERAGVKLQVGFNRRFDPTFKRVRELVAQGAVGTPHLLRITSRDPEPPPLEYVKVSGGIFLDMTIHDFDMARYLMGEEVEEVYAMGAVLVDPSIGQAGDVDTAVVTLRFRSGAMGVIDNSRKAVYGYDQRVEVFGSGGMAAGENRTPDAHVLADGQGIHRPKPLYFFLERYMDSFIAEMQAFVAALQEDREPPVTGRDGRMAVVLGLAAWKSLREERPVRVSEVS